MNGIMNDSHNQLITSSPENVNNSEGNSGVGSGKHFEDNRFDETEDSTTMSSVNGLVLYENGDLFDVDLYDEDEEHVDKNCNSSENIPDKLYCDMSSVIEDNDQNCSRQSDRNSSEDQGENEDIQGTNQLPYDMDEVVDDNNNNNQEEDDGDQDELMFMDSEAGDSIEGEGYDDDDDRKDVKVLQDFDDPEDVDETMEQDVELFIDENATSEEDPLHFSNKFTEKLRQLKESIDFSDQQRLCPDESSSSSNVNEIMMKSVTKSLASFQGIVEKHLEQKSLKSQPECENESAQNVEEKEDSKTDNSQEESKESNNLLTVYSKSNDENEHDKLQQIKSNECEVNKKQELPLPAYVQEIMEKDECLKRLLKTGCLTISQIQEPTTTTTDSNSLLCGLQMNNKPNPPVQKSTVTCTPVFLSSSNSNKSSLTSLDWSEFPSACKLIRLATFAAEEIVQRQIPSLAAKHFGTLPGESNNNKTKTSSSSDDFNFNNSRTSKTSTTTTLTTTTMTTLLGSTTSNSNSIRPPKIQLISRNKVSNPSRLIKLPLVRIQQQQQNRNRFKPLATKIVSFPIAMQCPRATSSSKQFCTNTQRSLKNGVKFVYPYEDVFEEDSVMNGVDRSYIDEDGDGGRDDEDPPEFDPTRFLEVSLHESNNFEEDDEYYEDEDSAMPEPFVEPFYDVVNVVKVNKSQSAPSEDDLRRKYKCPHCLKGFCWSTDLKRHILTHTGERPFKCNLCSANFTRKFLMQKHVRKYHGIEPSSVSSSSSPSSSSNTAKMTITPKQHAQNTSISNSMNNRVMQPQTAKVYGKRPIPVATNQKMNPKLHRNGPVTVVNGHRNGQFSNVNGIVQAGSKKSKGSSLLNGGISSAAAVPSEDCEDSKFPSKPTNPIVINVSSKSKAQAAVAAASPSSATSALKIEPRRINQSLVKQLIRASTQIKIAATSSNNLSQHLSNGNMESDSHQLKSMETNGNSRPEISQQGKSSSLSFTIPRLKR